MAKPLLSARAKNLRDERMAALEKRGGVRGPERVPARPDNHGTPGAPAYDDLVVIVMCLAGVANAIVRIFVSPRTGHRLDRVGHVLEDAVADLHRPAHHIDQAPPPIAQVVMRVRRPVDKDAARLQLSHMTPPRGRCRDSARHDRPRRNFFFADSRAEPHRRFPA